MTFPYEIDAERGRVQITVSGSVHGRDIAETIETVYCDPFWQTGFDIVWDCTRITQLFLEQEDQPHFCWPRNRSLRIPLWIAPLELTRRSASSARTSA